MSLSLLDLALRAATIAMLLVLAATLFRDYRHVVAGRLAVAFALGSMAHVLTYAIGGRQYLVIAVSGGSYSGEYLAFALPAR